MDYPEQVHQVCTGYDGSWRAVLHTPTLTTIIGREKQLGVKGICQLHTHLNGEDCDILMSEQQIQPGISCGYMTQTENVLPVMRHHITSRMELCERRKNYMASNQLSRFTSARSLDELAAQIDELAYTQFDIIWLDVCLFEDWAFDFRDSIRYRKAESSLQYAW